MNTLRFIKRQSARRFAPHRLNGLVMAMVVVLAMFTQASSVQADQITLRAHVRVAGPDVHLKDVAKLQGSEATAMGELALGTLGDQGLTISLAQLRSTLDDKGVNWGKLSLSGFMNCKVTAQPQPNKTKPVDKAPDAGTSGSARANPPKYVASDSLLTLGDQVTADLIKHSGFDKSDVRVTYSPRDTESLNKSILVDRWEVEPLNSARLGRVLVTVRQWRDSRIIQTYRLTADVARRALCVVTKNNIKRNDLITAKDVEIQEVYLQDDHYTPVVKLQDVIGRVATEALGRGEVVYTKQAAKPNLVKRGGRVTVRCIVGGMVIKTAARAMESGAMGDTITVANVDSNEKFIVQIVGPSQAVLPTAKAPGVSGVKEKKS